MDFDDLVVGSGIGALGAVLGLLETPGRRVGVLCGPADKRFIYYDQRQTLPCAFLGEGGMGSHWHGVIPLGWTRDLAPAGRRSFESLFARFYPRARLEPHWGRAGFFVPWKPIRPAAELRLLAKDAAHAKQLALIEDAAGTVRFDERGASVATPHGRTLKARRVWVAAGALHTPDLLARSLGDAAIRRSCISDHVFCYVGQVQGQPGPTVERSRDGAFFPAHYDAASTALYTLRPAVFAFRTLDHGIEQRAVFGMPTGHAVAKIARRLSPGLLVEACFNRFGILGRTRMHSVYAQLPVADAYERVDAALPLVPRMAAIQRALDAARAAQPFAGVTPTARPELHLPGIHLHHSIDLPALSRAGINTPDSPVQVVDASVMTDIGPDHHSFRMMLDAHERACRPEALA